MKKLSEISLGYSDAINYRKNPSMLEMFNDIFVRDEKLERLMRCDTYFLIGEKGTGKTAYATFLENKEYKGTISKTISLSTTDFLYFLKMQKLGYLGLTDLTRIWKIILLMIMTKEIRRNDIDEFGPRRSKKFEELQENIDRYYSHGFKPEIASSIRYVFDNTNSGKVGLSFDGLGLTGNASIDKKTTKEMNLTEFQNNLLLLEMKFSQAFERLKLKKTHFIFIDNVDIRIDEFSVADYYVCLQNLATAIWEIDTGIFREMTSTSFLKIILSIRPDIFAKLNLHNQANKVRDNGIILDWRTTYEEYRTSGLFKLCNRLLAHNNSGIDANELWDYYFPWTTRTTSQKRDYDDSFINCIRMSLSRPRDLISIMQAIQSFSKKHERENGISTDDDFLSNETQNAISEYYLAEARDWCLYKFASSQVDTLLYFFEFLSGKTRFSYDEYTYIYEQYFDSVDKKKMEIFDEIYDKDKLLQLLYELNMVWYLDINDFGLEKYRYCYRERSITKMSPQIKPKTVYGVHQALYKALDIK